MMSKFGDILIFFFGAQSAEPSFGGLRGGAGVSVSGLVFGEYGNKPLQDEDKSIARK